MNSYRFKSILCLSRAGALASIVIVQSLWGQALYHLGTLGGTSSVGLDINNAGQVTGSSNTAAGPSHGFLYFDGVMTDLGPDFSARAINEFSQMTGASFAPTGNQAAIYSGGVITGLGTLGATHTVGNDINNSGQVAGSWYNAGTGNFGAFLYSGGVMSDLGSLGGVSTFGTTFSSAEAINDLGQVVGNSWNTSVVTHAFIYSGGVMTDIGTLGGRFSHAYDINDSGQVTGSASIAGDGKSPAFLYSDGVMTDLGTLSGSLTAIGYGINNSGQVVGRSGPNLNSAFLYSGGMMRDLNSLYLGLLSHGGLPGFVSLWSAEAINDDGLITGTGSYFDGTRTHVGRAYVLDTRGDIDYSHPPAPDTGTTLGLLAFSMVGLVLLRQRRS